MGTLMAAVGRLITAGHFHRAYQILTECSQGRMTSQSWWAEASHGRDQREGSRQGPLPSVPPELGQGKAGRHLQCFPLRSWTQVLVSTPTLTQY